MLRQIQTGSEFLLSTSGSFKRFDTIDKEDYNRSQQQLLQQQQQQQQQQLLLGNGCDTTTTTTTPLWNLPQVDESIPPQPLRPAPAPAPAPAPNSAGPNSKTVTFSFSQINELSSTGSATAMSSPCLERAEPRSCLRGVALPQPLEAPPPPRLTSSASVQLSATAIPRPIAKRQVSLQQGINRQPQPELELLKESETDMATTTQLERRAPSLKRRNSSTNPFLCESTEINAAAPTFTPTTATTFAPTSAPTCAPTSAPQHNGNPFVTGQSLSSRLLKLHNTNNPFSGLSQRVKGPHMLQKTISEDYLFRKLGVNGHANLINANANANANGNGNSTWCFGRSLMRQDSSISLGLGRRNSSQLSLDGSLEGINLEHAISCDSVNSDASSSLCLDQLDQPYTQITGYLCVGLQYEK